MNRLELVQECDQQVRELLPEERRAEQKALAGMVCGVVCEQRAQLTHASAGMPGVAQDRSKLRRAQRLLANPRLSVRRAQRRLIARVLQGRRGRLDLFLDATTTGATAHSAGTVTLCFAVAWHHRALPLIWRTWTADAPGQDWTAAIREMAGVLTELLAELLPGETHAGTQVVVMTDRGLSGSTLARLAQDQGWHYLLRVTRHTRVCLEDGQVCEVADLVPQPGSRRCLSSVRYYAPRRKARSGAGGWVTQWDEAMSGQVVAVWRRQEEEAWLLLTDLPASVARCAEYRRRTWEEELFRDLKGMGWQWQASRVRAPERVERLVLVLALATLWMAAVAQRVLRRGWRRQLEERSRRCYSAFQLALRYLRRCLANDQPVPLFLHLYPETHAPLKLS